MSHISRKLGKIFKLISLKKQNIVFSDENHNNCIHQNKYSKPFEHAYQVVGQSGEFLIWRIRLPQLFCKFSFKYWFVWLNILAIGNPVFNRVYLLNPLCVWEYKHMLQVFGGNRLILYIFQCSAYLAWAFCLLSQKNNCHKSNNLCQSVSRFQLMKAFSKLIQPLFYLTTGSLMKLIRIVGIPNTVVTMEISAAACIPHCAKYP